MKHGSVLPGYGEAFLRLFYPSHCTLCEQLLELEERGLCFPCASGLQKFKLFPSEERLRMNLSWGDAGWALFRYDGTIKEVFHKIKFQKRRDLIRLFAEEIRAFFARRPELGLYDYVAAIPQDSRRRLEREFNQSEVIASYIRKILKRRGKGLLTKKRLTPPQSLLGREERLLNLQGMFRVPSPARIREKSVLLVDDIFTTGATLEEAARTLKQAGALEIGYFVLARTFAG